MNVKLRSLNIQRALNELGFLLPLKELLSVSPQHFMPHIHYNFRLRVHNAFGHYFQCLLSSSLQCLALLKINLLLHELLQGIKLSMELPH